MRVLIIHNHYVERGGEDEVVESEKKLLEDHGNEVILYERSNREIENFGFLKKIKFLIKDIAWSEETYKEIKKIIKNERPDIVHIHNVFLVVSPSVYYAVSEENIPVVQALHNFRLICPNGVLYRRNKVCEKCTFTNFIPALINRCWKNSFFLTYTLVRALTWHQKNNNIHVKINAYTVLSQFYKDKYEEKGLIGKNIFIKPNFVKIEKTGRDDFQNYILFVGRIANYKGIKTVANAFKKLPEYNLKVIGRGPLFEWLEKEKEGMPNLEIIGVLPHSRTIEYIRKSSFVIFSSECYEGTPRVVIESFACGVPVLAGNIGFMGELIQEVDAGILYKSQDANDMADKIRFLMGNRDLLVRMGKNARKIYEEKYTPDKNYNTLMEIYKKTISYAQNKF